MVPRFTLFLVVASLTLAGAPLASAQDTSTLGDYTSTTPTTPTPTPTPTTPTATPAPATGDTPTPLTGQSEDLPVKGTGSGSVKPSRTSGSEEDTPASGTQGESAGGTVPVAAPAATSSTPQNLAFTGGQPVLIGAAGLLLMGLAVVMQRRRRGAR